MPLPPLVKYETSAQYRQHYERVYCRGKIQTPDEIRVYFDAKKFDHAFYESAGWDGRKDTFSEVRAQRIDWIQATLTHPDATLFQGWNKTAGQVDATRRVAVVYEDFVVVIALSLKQDLALKANFITCYQADSSIGKIQSSPTWSREECIRSLTKAK
ncbi:hypothetical protein PK69_17850 [Xanthomonas phaseoli pv. phaseoli]|uniref:Uncharacterized protein n=1 Tax=Xanthomonas campestris pv. phaseoli TaxID=317013 RepID=A0AB38E3V3_XANCH|nr:MULTISPECIES: hypothetical protein [Xanthomonas]ATS22881.1 hypothetical protein XppCFBP412P_16615 [Xanthomonas phaseoli pv. phaseoli]ATS25787.1 hypothetical protein XppCFBP6164P_09600 [Xanthomonas phaseoli pv. phaseoli]ATS30712.1 hypothetical protein XppCFBP6546P_14120 [Xanthomonas phaseoli pv. phaseoli]ATS34038.1 hypothetical protein XppCFBP6982P_09025 [Xanthomonas phaseoli pv. phaseoli]AZU15026.1 hypothetical protein AC609_20565 [Xanthomonas phaseoli pv. phaseoli]